MNEAEKRAFEEARKKVSETTTPMIEQRALPDKMPKREDLK